MSDIQIVHINSGLDTVASLPTCLALGNFDGVHIGHQKLIREAKKLAERNNLTCSLMTFTPHPRTIIAKYADYHNLITPWEIKKEILSELGVDIVYLVEFTKEFSEVSPLDFITQFIQKVNAQTVVIGEDYRFGCRGQGNYQTLVDYGQVYDFQVVAVSPVIYKTDKVSSSIIRQMLAEGSMEEVNFLLGHPHQLRGEVVHGEKRGRLLGFPTANLRLTAEYVVPKRGVYAVEVTLNRSGNDKIMGLMNIGCKPTFHGNQIEHTIEVYLLDFHSDIYGAVLHVDIMRFIREEIRFADMDALRRQITSDVHNVRLALQT